MNAILSIGLGLAAWTIATIRHDDEGKVDVDRGGAFEEWKSYVEKVVVVVVDRYEKIILFVGYSIVFMLFYFGWLDVRVAAGLILCFAGLQS